MVIHAADNYLLSPAFEPDAVLGTRVQKKSDRHVPEVTELTHKFGEMDDRKVNTFMMKTISVPVV